MKKVQSITLKVFLSCMVITAMLMLVFVWNPAMESSGTQGPAPIMQYVLTFFIVGLASFLTWFTAIVLEIKNKLTSNH